MKDDAERGDPKWESNPVNQLLFECVEAPIDQRDARLETICGEHPEHAAELRRRFQRAAAMGLLDPLPADMAGAESAERRIGPYRIVDEIGRGGQAVVYLAEHRELRRKVALKVLNVSSGVALDAETRLKRFRREAAVTSRLDYPGICSVYETGEDDGLAWIAMRFVPGETLGQKIARSRKTAAAATHVVTLPESSGHSDTSDALPSSSVSPVRGTLMRAVVLIEKVARALHIAHEEGLIHRDVKPGNVMVTEAGVPVLVDFGMAHDEESMDYSLTQPGELMGTPYYMSPEQLLAKRVSVDRRTDVYSLGVTLYECVTLRRAFDAPTREGLYRQICFESAPDPRRYNRHIPRDLKVVIDTAIDSHPARRYATALDFAEDLRRFRTFEPVLARPAGPVLRTTRWVQRHRVASMFIALMTVALVIVSWLLVEVSRGLQRARALNLVAAAKEEIARDPTLALLLAREAVRLDPGQLSLFHRVLAERIPTAEVRHPVHPEANWDWCGWCRDGARLLTIHSQVRRLPGRPTRASVWSAGGTLLTTIEPAVDIRWATDPERPASCRYTPTNWPWAVSADGHRVALVLADGSLGIWEVSDEGPARPASVSLGTQADPIATMSYEPSSDRLFVVVRSGAAAFHDWVGGSQPVRPAGPRPTSNVRFSATGDRVAFGCDDGYLEVRRAASGELCERLRLGDCAVRAIVVSAAFETFAATLSDGRLVVWHRDRGAVQPLIAQPDARKYIYLAMSANGERIFGFHGQDLFSRDGTHLAHVEEPITDDSPSDYIRDYAFAPDGEHFVTTHAGSSRLRIWTSDGKLVRTLRNSHAWRKNTVRWLEGGARLLYAHGPEVGIFDVGGKHLVSFHASEGFEHSALASDGLRLAATPEDGRVLIWDLDRRDLPTWTPGGVVMSFAISTDGTRIATALEAGMVRLWTRDGERLAEFGDPGLPVSGVSFSPGARYLAMSQLDQVASFEIASKARIFYRRSDAAYRNFSRVQYSHDGEDLVVRSSGAVLAWSLDDVDKPRFTLTSDGLAGAQSIRCSPRGEHVIATYSASGHAATLACWTLAGELLWSRTIDGPRWPHDAAFSSDGSQVLASYDGGRVELRTADGDVVRAYDHATEAVLVNFSPDGQRFLTVGSDNAVRIWTLDGQLQATLDGHADRVTGASFTPEGRRVITSSRDGTLRTWYADNDELRERAMALPVRDFTARERTTYGELLPKD